MTLHKDNYIFKLKMTQVNQRIVNSTSFYTESEKKRGTRTFTVLESWKRTIVEYFQGKYLLSNYVLLNLDEQTRINTISSPYSPDVRAAAVVRIVSAYG